MGQMRAICPIWPESVPRLLGQMVFCRCVEKKAIKIVYLVCVCVLCGVNNTICPAVPPSMPRGGFYPTKPLWGGGRAGQQDRRPFSAGSVGSENERKSMNETTAPDAPVATETAMEPKDDGSVGDHEMQREETD